MTTTLQGIRDFARNTLQTDSVDLPNSLVDVYANESQSRIIAMRQDWAHLYAEGTFNTVSGTQSYSLSSLTPTTFTYIQNVWDDSSAGRSLVELDYQQAAAYWIGPTNTTTDDPQFFAQNGAKLYLYPKPNNIRTLRVSGFRAAVDMANSTDVPDLPAQLHNPLMYGAVSIAYAQQEDIDMASFWGNMANQSYQAQIRTLFFRRRNHPIVYGGRGYAPFNISYDEWVRRNAR